MNEVVGVKDCNTNQILYIKTLENYNPNDMLVIDSGNGEYIYKCVKNKQTYDKLKHSLLKCKKVRKASSDELNTYLQNQTEKEQYKQIFKQMCNVYNVNTLLVNIDFSLDHEHIKYTYFSIEKLQFANLIQYLLENNPKRYKIQFYQVGEREYYAINGGVGVCGYELCCHSRSYSTPIILSSTLVDLGINLNFKKNLLGTCSKYKCCLLFDTNDLKDLKQNLPDINELLAYNGEQVIVTNIDLNKKIVFAQGQKEYEISFDYFLKGNNVNNK